MIPLLDQPVGDSLQAPEIDYWAMTPLLIVLGAACVAVLVEAFLAKPQRWPVQVVLSVLTFGLAGLTLGVRLAESPKGVTTIAGALAIDHPTVFLWGTLLALGIGAMLVIADRSVEPGGAFVASAAIRLWRRPAVTIGLFAYVIAALCVGALVIALHMPAFGARFDQAGDDIGLYLADGRVAIVQPEAVVTISSSAGSALLPCGSSTPPCTAELPPTTMLRPL